MWVWLALMLVGFAGSALYSGLETGAYTLNPVRLHVRSAGHNASATRLRRLLDRPPVLLATLLIGNNIMNNLGTSGLTTLLDGVGFGFWETIAITVLVATPVLFVFGETLPKDLFAAHADRLMYPLERVLTASRWAFTLCGLVPLVTLFSGVVTRMMGKGEGGGGGVAGLQPRGRVGAMVREGVGHGVLSDEQSAIVERVLRLGERTVGDEMTPWDQTLCVRASDPPARLWELAETTSRSRFPLMEERGVVGLVDVMDALAYGDAASCPPVRELMRDVIWLPADWPLRRGLGELQRRHVPLAVVRDEGGRPVGVVTVKDLVEPITGELASW